MRLIALVTLALATVLAFGATAFAQPFTSPKALLEDAYKSYATDEFPDDLMVYYSSALKALWATADAKVADDEVGAVDFDPFINAQDYEITGLAIGDPVTAADGSVTVTVTFVNMGEAQTMEFTLVQEGAGWLVDDVAALTPGYEFRLSELLSEH